MATGVGTAGRNACHAVSCTIIADDSDGNHDEVSFPISVEPKGADYSQAESILLEDLNTLSEGATMMYYNTMHLNVPVNVQVYGYLMDVPATRDACGATHHTSNRLQRWRHLSQLVGPAFHKLQSCNRCLTSRSARLGRDVVDTDANACEECCDWNMGSNTHLLVGGEMPRGFPTECSLEKAVDFMDGTKPREISFSTFREAVRFVCHEHIVGEFSKREAQTYLVFNGISPGLAKKFVTSLRSSPGGCRTWSRILHGMMRGVNAWVRMVDRCPKRKKCRRRRKRLSTPSPPWRGNIFPSSGRHEMLR